MPDQEHADVKSAIKDIFRSGLKEVQNQRAKLEERQNALTLELNNIQMEIAKLDKDLAVAIRDAMKELGIATEAAPHKERRTRKRSGQSMSDWILDLLRQHRQLHIGKILQYATEANLNPKSVSVQLCKMAQKAMIKAERIPGEKGKTYSPVEGI